MGIIDMGGASLQIAYEVPGAITFSSPQEVTTPSLAIHQGERQTFRIILNLGLTPD